MRKLSDGIINILPFIREYTAIFIYGSERVKNQKVVDKLKKT